MQTKPKGSKTKSTKVSQVTLIYFETNIPVVLIQKYSVNRIHFGQRFGPSIRPKCEGKCVTIKLSCSYTAYISSLKVWMFWMYTNEYLMLRAFSVLAIAVNTASNSDNKYQKQWLPQRWKVSLQLTWRYLIQSSTETQIHPLSDSGFEFLSVERSIQEGPRPQNW